MKTRAETATFKKAPNPLTSPAKKANKRKNRKTKKPQNSEKTAVSKPH